MGIKQDKENKKESGQGAGGEKALLGFAAELKFQSRFYFFPGIGAAASFSSCHKRAIIIVTSCLAKV